MRRNFTEELLQARIAGMAAATSAQIAYEIFKIQKTIKHAGTLKNLELLVRS